MKWPKRLEWWYFGKCAYNLEIKMYVHVLSHVYYLVQFRSALECSPVYHKCPKKTMFQEPSQWISLWTWFNVFHVFHTFHSTYVFLIFWQVAISTDQLQRNSCWGRWREICCHRSKYLLVNNLTSLCETLYWFLHFTTIEIFASCSCNFLQMCVEFIVFVLE